MYKAITERFSNINQSEVARKVGIAAETINRIINSKQNCSKMTAYCIVKAINEKAEIEDYFIRNEE